MYVTPHYDAPTTCDRLLTSDKLTPAPLPVHCCAMPPKHERLTGSMNTQPEPEISANQIRQIAALCHIGLTDDEVEELRVEMAKLVSEVSVLQRIDTTGVEPTGSRRRRRTHGHAH